MKVQINKNMKTTNKPATQISPHECCMCGDYGFSYELFHCKVCQFRSQHRYCSNLYPNISESHRICNWCLSQKNDTKDKSQNSSNSSSSFKNDDNNNSTTIVKVKNKAQFQQRIGRSRSGVIGPIKKQRSPELSPPAKVSGRKRIVTAAAKEAAAAERLRRTRSEDISNNVGVTKQVFRSRVRRYKLLDEVSS